MQQIINAIDHLAGHSHWRDQGVFHVGGEGKGVGLTFLESEDVPAVEDQLCITAIVNRDNAQPLMDLMLDAGAPGLNVSYSRLTAGDDAGAAQLRINEEFAFMRCITERRLAERICGSIDASAEEQDICDLCVLTHPVSRVATYVPGLKDYRAPKRFAAA